MDWMQFVSALVSALAWPGAAFGIVFVLKDPILNAIPNIRSFKYGELHIDLSEKLKAVEEELTAAPSESSSPSQTSPSPSPETVRMAEASPVAAMILAWRKVETALDEAVLRQGLVFGTKRAAQPAFKILALKEKGLLDDLTVTTFRRLYSLRNSVVHGSAHGHGEMDVGLADALSMAQSCEWLVERLNTV
jgi:hypothetical protein